VNGGNSLVRQYSISHVFVNSMDTFATYDLSLLFPGKAEYKLKPAAALSYLVQTESEYGTDPVHYEFEGKGAPSAAFRTSLGRTRFLSLASFSSRGFWGVQTDLNWVILTNRSSYLLQNCQLIRKGESIPIGEIPSGKELRLNLASVQASSDPLSGSSRPFGILSKTIDVYETENFSGSTGDCIVCAMNNAIPSLESDTRLSYSGSTAVIYHLGSREGRNRDLDQK
jgi:hypothetical protein